MLILNVWHPDVLEFIDSQARDGAHHQRQHQRRHHRRLHGRGGGRRRWELVFPDTSHPPTMTDVGRRPGAPGAPRASRWSTHKTVKARELWNAIIESAWASAEPGVLFVDRYNKTEQLLVLRAPRVHQSVRRAATAGLGRVQPGRDQPGALRPRTRRWTGTNLGETVRYAVRFLDNVIDATPYFFEENQRQQMGERRVGLGTMGLAEMLIRLQHPLRQPGRRGLHRPPVPLHRGGGLPGLGRPRRREGPLPDVRRREVSAERLHAAACRRRCGPRCAEQGHAQRDTADPGAHRHHRHHGQHLDRHRAVLLLDLPPQEPPGPARGEGAGGRGVVRRRTRTSRCRTTSSRRWTCLPKEHIAGAGGHPALGGLRASARRATCPTATRSSRRANCTN